MKTCNFQLSVLFVVLFSVSFSLYAQDGCSEYYPMQKGTKYQITSRDKKDKTISITENEILDSSTKDGKQTATIHTVNTDSKGKEVLNTDYNITCSGEGIIIDINSMMNNQMATQFKDSDAEVQVTGTNNFIPNDLQVGQKLPDVEMNIKVKAGSINMNFTINTYNREVIGQEKITVPAGTFDCIILSSETHSKMIVSKTTRNKLWLAKGVGLVKQEDYKKSGKITGSQILTSFTK